jgi:predicted phage tail component-like protein
MFNFAFNGVTKPYITVLEVIRPTWAQVKRNYLKVPGRPGAFLQDTEIETRPIGLKVLVNAAGYFDDLQKLKEDLAEWLITEKEEELVLENEPDRTYFAAVDGVLDLDELAILGQGVIQFTCSEPYKYGPEKGVYLTEGAPFYVEGTEITYPTIKVEMKQDTTFVAVSDGENMNLIGNPTSVTQQPFEREELMLWNPMESLVDWADTAAVEEGVITGNMTTTGYSFLAADYGTDAGWHGPAKKTSIGSVLQDFQIDARIGQKGINGQVGSVEIAFLDASNNFVGKMLMTKRSANSVANYARVRAGSSANGHDIIHTRGSTESVWANFEGLIRVSRVGNIWSVYVAQIDANGIHHSRFGETWPDDNGIATAPIAQIQVQVWQHGSIPSTLQYISDLQVFKINSPGDNQIPYVARVGDVIEFNHVEDKILKNGEPMVKQKAFIGEYFSLKKGKNTLFVEPAEAIEKVEVRWRPRWR